MAQKNPSRVVGALTQAIQALSLLTLLTIEGTIRCKTWTKDYAVQEDLRGAWSAIAQAEKCFVLTEVMVNSVMPNEALLLKRASENFATVTDLADLLVSVEGLSFREAHHVVGGLVRTCLEQGFHTSDINGTMLSQAAMSVIGRKVNISNENIAKCLDPRLAIAAREWPGGTASPALRKAVDEMSTILADDRKKVDEVERRISDADFLLRRVCRSISEAIKH